MTDINGAPTDDDLTRLWQQTAAGTHDPDYVARAIMAQVWTFNQKIFWRNFREYAAGIVLMVVFAARFALGDDRVGAAIGFVCVSFVMIYLWWKHRGLNPLDPAADATVYRTTLMARYEAQIRLLRTVPYWYLMPLFVPGVWTFLAKWPSDGWHTLAPIAVLVAVYTFVGWLNVVLGVRYLTTTRDRLVGMFADER
jgi:hypothetical protein